MPRRARLALAGVAWHIIQRGNNRTACFFADEDYRQLNRGLSPIITIYDSYRNPATGGRIPADGFLRAERNPLESRGWKYDSSTGAYHPPGN